MRFRRRQPAPNYLSGALQRRLLLLVMALGLVLILMREAGKPQRWEWFNLLTSAGPAGHEEAVDTRLATPEDSDKPGVIYAPNDADDAPLPAAAGGRYFPGVDTRLLARVRDDTIFRQQDYESWFNLCDVLRRHSPEQIADASTGDVTFLQLFQQPAAYRGELVTVAGVIRRAGYRPAPQNDVGVEGYYQAWLQPLGTGSSPMVIYLLELPKDFPIGDQLDAEVTLTGFFFKRWAYAAQDTIRTAPVLLARNLTWHQPPVVPREEPGVSPWLYALAALVGVALAALAFRFRPSPTSALKRYTEEEGETIAIPVESATPTWDDLAADDAHQRSLDEGETPKREQP